MDASAPAACPFGSFVPLGPLSYSASLNPPPVLTIANYTSSPSLWCWIGRRSGCVRGTYSNTHGEAWWGQVQQTMPTLQHGPADCATCLQTKRLRPQH